MLELLALLAHSSLGLAFLRDLQWRGGHAHMGPLSRVAQPAVYPANDATPWPTCGGEKRCSSSLRECSAYERAPLLEAECVAALLRDVQLVPAISRHV